MAPPRKKKSVRSAKPSLPLSEVRRQLSPLVRAVEERKDAVGISVRGEVRAYLVSADQYDVARRRRRLLPFSIRDSARLIGSPDESERAIQHGHDEALAETLRELDEFHR